METIIVKEIDKFKSMTHKDVYVSQYIIYIAIDDGNKNIRAFTEFGEEAKDARVKQLSIIINK